MPPYLGLGERRQATHRGPYAGNEGGRCRPIGARHHHTLSTQPSEPAPPPAPIPPRNPTNGRPRNLIAGGTRFSIADLEHHEIHRGSHPGDRFIRRGRVADEGFRRLGPGHLEALPAALASTTRSGRLFDRLKRLLIGTPLSTAAAHHERLNKAQALAVLSSDALSSVAYATEAVLGALLLAGAGAFNLNIPVALAIAALIGILVFSYRQTIHAYPNGGGSYIGCPSVWARSV